METIMISASSVNVKSGTLLREGERQQSQQQQLLIHNFDISIQIEKPFPTTGMRENKNRRSRNFDNINNNNNNNSGEEIAGQKVISNNHPFFFSPSRNRFLIILFSFFMIQVMVDISNINIRLNEHQLDLLTAIANENMNETPRLSEGRTSTFIFDLIVIAFLIQFSLLSLSQWNDCNPRC